LHNIYFEQFRDVELRINRTLLQQ